MRNNNLKYTYYEDEEFVVLIEVVNNKLTARLVAKRFEVLEGRFIKGVVIKMFYVNSTIKRPTEYKSKSLENGYEKLIEAFDIIVKLSSKSFHELLLDGRTKKIALILF